MAQQGPKDVTESPLGMEAIAAGRAILQSQHAYMSNLLRWDGSPHQHVMDSWQKIITYSMVSTLIHSAYGRIRSPSAHADCGATRAALIRRKLRDGSMVDPTHRKVMPFVREDYGHGLRDDLIQSDRWQARFGHQDSGLADRKPIVGGELQVHPLVGSRPARGSATW